MSIISLKQRLLSGGLWALVGRMAGVLLAVIINVLLSRILSPEAMGAYFLAFSLVVVYSTIAQLGLSQVVVRLVAESMQREQLGRAAKAIRLVFFYGSIGSATVGGVIYFGVGDWLAEYVLHSIRLIEVMGWVALWVVSFAFQSLFAETFRGFHDIKSAALFGGVTSSVFTILLIVAFWFLYHQSTLERVIIYSVVGVMVNNLIAFFCIKRTYVTLRGENDLYGREVLKMAFPLLVTNVTVIALSQVGLWIVGIYLTQEDVAVYGAASRLAQIMMLVTSVLYAFLPPLIAQLHEKKDTKMLQDVLQTGALLNTLLVLPLLLMVVFFSGDILGLLYGKFYSRGSGVLVMLASGLFVNVLTGMRGYVLMMTGREKMQMYISLFGGCLNALACVVGALCWGINGVAFAAMFSMVVQCLIELWAVRFTMGLWSHGLVSPVAAFEKAARLIRSRL